VAAKVDSPAVTHWPFIHANLQLCGRVCPHVQALHDVQPVIETAHHSHPQHKTHSTASTPPALHKRPIAPQPWQHGRFEVTCIDHTHRSLNQGSMLADSFSLGSPAKVCNNLGKCKAHAVQSSGEPLEHIAATHGTTTWQILLDNPLLSAVDTPNGMVPLRRYDVLAVRPSRGTEELRWQWIHKEGVV
jgi:hypothetical protein